MKEFNIWQNALYIYVQANKFSKGYKYKMISSIVLTLLVPVVATLIPAITVYVIVNNYSIVDFVLVVGGVVGIYAILNYANSYVSHIVFFDKIFIRTNSFFELLTNKTMATGYENMEFEKGRNKLMKAVGAIEANAVGVELFLQVFPVFITSLIGIVVYSTYIASINLWIVLVLIGMGIVNLLLNAYARKYEKKTVGKLNKYRTKLTYFQDEANKLSNAKDIRIYRLEEWFYNGIKFFTKKFSTTVMNQKLRYSFANLSDSIFSIVRNLIAYTILVTMVLDGFISIAEFTFMLGIVFGLSVWLNQLSGSFGRLKEANIRVDHFRDYMDLEDGIKMSEGENVNGLLHKALTIEFKNVSFTYPNTDQPIFDNFSLKIKAGENVALVGNNGAGKTTLVKLLTGLYNTTKGDIYINGIKVEEFNKYEYYELFGVIFQDIHTLPFSIAQNVSGNTIENTDMNKVKAALQKAGLLDKVESLQKKEFTNLTQVIDDKGIMLSGGELQKLMLARAIYKNAPILVLDEPTAALDPLAEQELYLMYNNLTDNKTSLFISHRLASTQFCDRIILLDDGKAIEEGSHRELMQLKGKYAEMFDIQSQYYKENKKEEIQDEI